MKRTVTAMGWISKGKSLKDTLECADTFHITDPVKRVRAALAFGMADTKQDLLERQWQEEEGTEIIPVKRRIKLTLEVVCEDEEEE